MRNKCRHILYKSIIYQNMHEVYTLFSSNQQIFFTSCNLKWAKYRPKQYAFRFHLKYLQIAPALLVSTSLCILFHKDRRTYNFNIPGLFKPSNDYVPGNAYLIQLLWLVKKGLFAAPRKLIYVPGKLLYLIVLIYFVQSFLHVVFFKLADVLKFYNNLSSRQKYHPKQ